MEMLLDAHTTETFTITRGTPPAEASLFPAKSTPLLETAEIPATHPAWHPTPSQKEAIQKLHLSANVFSRVGDRKLAGFSPACRRLLMIGASGAGKSAVAREFARQRDLRMLVLDGGSWIVAGSQKTATLRLVLDFIRATPISDGNAESQPQGIEGAVFIDEICKLVPKPAALADSGWNMSVWAECIGLLESDSRLLTHGWSQLDVERFRSRWLILAGGAFQLALQEVRQASGRGTLGFSPSSSAKATHSAQIANYLPEEILSRFCDPILLEPPSRKDLCNAIGRIHGELGIPLSRPLSELLDEAVKASGGMRWVEHYLCSLLSEHPYAVRPTPGPDKPASVPRAYDLLGADYAAQAKTVSELSIRLRTCLGMIYARLSSFLSSEKQERVRSLGGLLCDPQVGESIVAAIEACALLQTVGPAFDQGIEDLATWRSMGWKGITEQSYLLEQLGLTATWVEAWSLGRTVLDYHFRFSQASKQGCFR
jgi:hypothetical protein